MGLLEESQDWNVERLEGREEGRSIETTEGEGKRHIREEDAVEEGVGFSDGCAGSTSCNRDRARQSLLSLAIHLPRRVVAS